MISVVRSEQTWRDSSFRCSGLPSRGFGVVWADPALTASFMAESDRNLGAALKAVGLAK